MVIVGAIQGLVKPKILFKSLQQKYIGKESDITLDKRINKMPIKSNLPILLITVVYLEISVKANLCLKEIEVNIE